MKKGSVVSDAPSDPEIQGFVAAYAQQCTPIIIEGNVQQAIKTGNPTIPVAGSDGAVPAGVPPKILFKQQ